MRLLAGRTLPGCRETRVTSVTRRALPDEASCLAYSCPELFCTAGKGTAPLLSLQPSYRQQGGSHLYGHTGQDLSCRQLHCDPHAFIQTRRLYLGKGASAFTDTGLLRVLAAVLHRQRIQVWTYG